MKVVYNTSEEYSYYTSVSILSFLDNNQNSDDLEYYIIDAGMEEKTIVNIKKIFMNYDKNCHFIGINKIEKKIKRNCNVELISHNGSINIWMTVFPHLIFPDFDGLVLFIDSDTIVNNSIAPLTKLNWENKVIAGVNCPKLHVEKEFLNQKSEIYKEEIKIIKNRQNEYLNSGFLIYNMKNFYTSNCDKTLDKKLSELSIFALKDQTSINHLYNREKVIELDQKYNSYFHSYPKYSKKIESVKKLEIGNIDEAINNPVIIHFVGPLCRPWFKETRNHFVSRYDYYENLLPFEKKTKESFFDCSYFKNSSLVTKIKLIFIVSLYNTKIFGIYHTIKNRY